MAAANDLSTVWYLDLPWADICDSHNYCWRTGIADHGAVEGFPLATFELGWIAFYLKAAPACIVVLSAMASRSKEQARTLFAHKITPGDKRAYPGRYYMSQQVLDSLLRDLNAGARNESHDLHKSIMTTRVFRIQACTSPEVGYRISQSATLSAKNVAALFQSAYLNPLRRPRGAKSFDKNKGPVRGNDIDHTIRCAPDSAERQDAIHSCPLV